MFDNLQEIYDALMRMPEEIGVCETSLSDSIRKIKQMEEDYAAACDLAILKATEDGTINGKNAEDRKRQSAQVIRDNPICERLRVAIRNQEADRDKLQVDADMARRKYGSYTFLARLKASELAMMAGEVRAY